MVKNLFKNGFSLLAAQQTSILSAAFLLMLAVVASRLLGLVRDRLLASYFGASPELASYIAASRLPEMFFEILVTGALAIALIPVFTEYLSREQKEKAWQVASSVLNLTFIFFTVVAIFLFIFAENLIPFVAPGLVEQHSLIANLMRVMLFAQFFFVVSIFLTGIAQSFQRFLVPALAAVLYNVGIILGIIFLSPSWGIYGPALGMVLGAFLQVVVQIPLVRSLGIIYRLNFDIFDPGVRAIGKLMLPQTVNLALRQINETVNIVLASLLSAKSIVALNFALHLQLVPIGLFGTTLAQAALPILSRQYAQRKLEDFKTTFLTSFHQILFLVLPASAILIILRIPVVRLVFGAARFDWEATLLTGQTLAFFSVSLFAQAVILLLVRGFYALRDTKTPLWVGVISVLTNVILSIIFVRQLNLAVWGLALAWSVASILNVLLLLYFLDQRVGSFERKRLFLPLFKIGLSSLLMAICLYIPMKILDQLVLDTTRTINLLILTILASGFGLTIYLFLTSLLGVEEVNLFWRFVAKIKNFRKLLSTPAPALEETVKP